MTKNAENQKKVDEEEMIIKPREPIPRMLTAVVKAIEPQSKIHDYLGTRR